MLLLYMQYILSNMTVDGGCPNSLRQVDLMHKASKEFWFIEHD